MGRDRTPGPDSVPGRGLDDGDAQPAAPDGTGARGRVAAGGGVDRRGERPVARRASRRLFALLPIIVAFAFLLSVILAQTRRIGDLVEQNSAPCPKNPRTQPSLLCQVQQLHQLLATLRVEPVPGKPGEVRVIVPSPSPTPAPRLTQRGSPSRATSTPQSPPRTTPRPSPSQRSSPTPRPSPSHSPSPSPVATCLPLPVPPPIGCR